MIETKFSCGSIMLHDGVEVRISIVDNRASDWLLTMPYALPKLLMVSVPFVLEPSPLLKARTHRVRLNWTDKGLLVQFPLIFIYHVNVITLLLQTVHSLD